MKLQTLNHHSDGCVTPASDWSRPLMRLIDVSMRYDRKKVLEHVDLTVNYGDFVAVTGPNGGGKTTLLRIILGLLKPTRGKVEFLRNNGELSVRPSVGYLPQKNMVDSQFPIIVREVIASGLLASCGLSRSQKRSMISEMISRVGLEQHAEAPIGALSGGQLQRALLGRALISHPRMLILDEPLSYIDKRFEARLYEIIRTVAEDTTIILVSHELSQIDHMANRHILVDRHVHECKADHHYIITHCDTDDNSC